MDLNEYQRQAVSTAIYAEQYKLIYPILGLNGEAGEVAEKMKKILRDSNGIISEENKEEFIKELGDTFWYLALSANDLGVSLEEVAQKNIAKLQSRKIRNKLRGDGDNR